MLSDGTALSVEAIVWLGDLMDQEPSPPGASQRHVTSLLGA